jgi:hypothetical protein
MNRKIDVMIVGAQKAGTTSLLRYFGEHPECISHPQKEFSYFTDVREFNEGWETAFKKYYAHAIIGGKKKLIAKNASLCTNAEGLKRLREHNPACKLFIILRNPVERTYSSYLMEKNFGSVNFEFTDLPDLIGKHQHDKSWDYKFFIDFSLYAHHIKTMYTFFPKEQVHILLYDELQQNPAELCKHAFQKTGVNDAFVPQVKIRHNVTQKTRSSVYARVMAKFLHNENPLKKAIKKFLPGHKVYKYGELLREINKTDKKHEGIPEETKKFLVDFYRPYNAELEELIGKDLSKWNS